MWAKNKNTFDAFNADYVEIARKINSLPKDLPKYIIVNSGSKDQRIVSISAQTIMFVTNTFLPEDRKEKNVFYILPDEIRDIPTSAAVFEI